MLNFVDKPLPNITPKPDRGFAWLARRANCWWRLPRILKITKIHTSSAPELSCIGPNDRMVLVSNHPSHTDAPVLLEALSRIGWQPRYLAAREVFLRGISDRWVLQHLGAIPIDRESASSTSLNWASEAIYGKKSHQAWPLTIFAEGNVFLQQDSPSKFADGASLMAVKAGKKYDAGTIWIVPIALRLTHTDPEQAILAHEARLQELESMLGLPAHMGTPLAHAVERLRMAGETALTRLLKQRGYEPKENESPIVTANQCAMDVLEDLCNKIDTPPPNDPDKWEASWQNCRIKIHDILSDPERHLDHKIAMQWADHAMLIARMASYKPGYLTERPCLNRIAETIEKLWEDITEIMPAAIAKREAHIHLCAPINVNQLLKQDGKLRHITEQLTAQTHQSIQDAIHLLRDNTQHPSDQPIQ